MLAVARDPELRAFARYHLDAEQQHHVLIEAVVPLRERCALLPLWRLSGWLTGDLPACIGPRAVDATIEAVETFVDRHYTAQIEQIDALVADTPAPAGSGATNTEAVNPLLSLRQLQIICQADEVAHREEAGLRWDHQPGAPLVTAWLFGCCCRPNDDRRTTFSRRQQSRHHT